MFGRYRVVRQIGSGGMGVVLEGVHADLEKPVAIKVLLPHLAQTPEVRERMLREGRAAAQIHHPNVVDIFDVGTQLDVPYLVMELLRGEDLGQRLKDRGAVTPAEAVDVLIPSLAGLAAAHARGVFHRDIKPGNVFLTTGPYGEEVPKLVDFGIAKSSAVDPDQPLTQTGALMGTPHYMAPEQVSADGSAGAPADQYGMAVVAYHAMSGKLPFRKQDSIYAVLDDVVHGRCVDLTEAAPSLPPDLCSVVAKAMATEPTDRFDSVLQFGAALLPFASERVRVQWDPVFSKEAAPSNVPEAAFDLPHTERDFDTGHGIRPPGLGGPPGRQRWAMAAAAALGIALGIWWIGSSAGTGPDRPTEIEAIAPEPGVPADPGRGSGPSDPGRGSGPSDPDRGSGPSEPDRRSGPSNPEQRAPKSSANGSRMPSPAQTPSKGPRAGGAGTAPTGPRAPEPTRRASDRGSRPADPGSGSSAVKRGRSTEPQPSSSPGKAKPNVELGTNDAPILQ
jgi:eukaryotic-like serine/threonine-protein kinase